jgi:predicted MFS family arabinose efflux permease
MGSVTIAMPAAQRVAKQVKGNLMAIMTLVYGVGQIAGPLLANMLYTRSHTFSSSLIAAACALVIAAAMSALSLRESADPHGEFSYPSAKTVLCRCLVFDNIDFSN